MATNSLRSRTDLASRSLVVFNRSISATARTGIPEHPALKITRPPGQLRNACLLPDEATGFKQGIDSLAVVPAEKLGQITE